MPRFGISRVAPLALATLIVGLALAVPAAACCRGEHLFPRGYERGERPLPPLAIGDSVMLGAARTRDCSAESRGADSGSGPIR